jgi:hypothetical protein
MRPASMCFTTARGSSADAPAHNSCPRPRASWSPQHTRCSPPLGIAALIIDVARDIAFMDELRHAGALRRRTGRRRREAPPALRK